MRKLIILFLFSGGALSAQAVGNDGSLQYAIPVVIPKGTGPTPQLKISYNSNNRNGMLGVGFHLEGLPMITRGNFGNGIYYNGNDTYFGPGGRLILQGSTSAEPRVYLPQNYNGSRYLAYGSCGDGPCYWVEETAGGAKQYFGTSDKVGSNSQGRAIAVDNPGQSGSVREWALGRVEDSEGRYFEVEWDIDEGVQYPVRITYTKGPGLSRYHTVTFVYDKTGRTDQELTYIQSAKVQTRWRLAYVIIESEEPILWGLFSYNSLVKKYNFQYKQSGSSYRTLLGIITMTDASATLVWDKKIHWQSEDTNTDLNKTLAVNVTDKSNKYVLEMKPANLNDGIVQYRAGNFSNKGKTELLRFQTDQIYWRHYYIGHKVENWSNFKVIDTGNLVGQTSGTLNTDTRHLFQADFNSDGKIDTLTIDTTQYFFSGGYCFAPCTAQPTSSTAPTWTIYLSNNNLNELTALSWPIQPLGADYYGSAGDGLKHLLQGDFNGDQKEDMLWFDINKPLSFAYISTGNSFQVQERSVPARDSSWGNTLDGLRHLKTGDFNGDGKTDLIWVNTGSTFWTVYLSSEDGFTVESWLVPTDKHFGHSSNQYRFLYTGDYNGDGKTDLLWVYTPGNKWYAYLSTGKGFSVQDWAVNPRAEATYGKVGDGLTLLYTGDYNGDGKTDMLWINTDKDKWYAYISVGNGFAIHTWLVPARDPAVFGKVNDGYRNLFSGDFDGNGKTDLLWAERGKGRFYQYNPSYNDDIISQIITSDTNIVNVSYQNITNMNTAIDSNAYIDCVSLQTCPEPEGNVLSTPTKLVTGLRFTAIDAITNSQILKENITYNYSSRRYFPGSVKERTGLGFARITTTFSQSAIKKEALYRQDSRFAGMPLATLVYKSGRLVSRTTYGEPKQYRCNDTGCAEDNTLVLLEPRQVRSGKVITIEYDSVGAQHTVPLLTKSQEVINYDLYGNPTEVVESVEANGSTKTVHQYAEYINEPGTASIRRMGLPYYQKKCLGNCSATDIIEESFIYFDNQPAGQLGNQGLITRKESLKAGVILTENLTYNSNGQLAEKVNDAGITEAFEYDSFGQLIKTTVTSGSKSIVREQKIDPRFGVKVWAKDENGIIAENDLDERGRVIESRTVYESEILQRASASYQTEIAPYSVTKCNHYGDALAFSSCKTVISDALGRKIYEITPSPQDLPGSLVAIKTEYDSLGRAYRVSEPYTSDINGSGSPLSWNTKTFDSRDRVVSLTSVDGKTSSTVYNPALIAESVASEEITGPDGSIRRIFFNLAGKPVLIQEAYGTPQQAELKYTYDQFDRLVRLVAPQGITEIEYDALGWQEFIKDPHAGLTEYTYVDDITSPAFGSLLTEKRPAPNAGAGFSETVTVNFEYNDAWGRLTKSTVSDGTTTTYAYDESDMSFSENKLTTLTHTSNDFTVTDRFSYDVYGEVKTTSRRFSHASWNLCENVDALPCFSVVSSEKDSLGRVTSFNYPDGTTGEFTYLREFSLPTAMKHEGNAMASWSGYDYRGQTGKVVYANGIETTWNYRADNGLLTETRTTTTESSPQVLLHQEYSFDNALNITGIQDHIINDYSVTFTYDKHNRLQTATRNGELREYKFDDQSKGNLLERRNLKLVYDTGAIRPQSTQIRDHETAPWQNSESFEWSAGGNLRFRNHANNSWEYSYNVDNMMKKAVDSAGNETLFFYDASGQRFLKVHKAVGKEEIRTWYLSDGYELREKFTPDGSQKLAGQATRYFYGPDGKRLASQTGEVTESLASLHYLYAGMFSGTIVGLVKKAYYYAKGALHDTQGRQFFLITLAVFLALSLSYYLYRQFEVYQNKSDRPIFIKQTAFVLIALFFNLSYTSCLGDGRISVVEKKKIYYNLNFDTIYDGLPVGTYYYTHDHLGSGSLITDASGNEYLRIVYDEYGNIDQHRSGKYNPATGSIADAAADANKLLLAVKFTGQEYDPETGLYYYNARYYDPALGLFTTPDVYVDGADTSAGYNRYSYVQGNPLRYSDPSGHNIFDEAKKWWDNASSKTKKTIIGGVGLVATGVAVGCFLVGALPCTYAVGSIAIAAFSNLGNRSDQNPNNDDDFQTRTPAITIGGSSSDFSEGNYFDNGHNSSSSSGTFNSSDSWLILDLFSYGNWSVFSESSTYSTSNYLAYNYESYIVNDAEPIFHLEYLSIAEKIVAMQRHNKRMSDLGVIVDAGVFDPFMVSGVVGGFRRILAGNAKSVAFGGANIARTPVGRLGKVLKVPPGTNVPTTILNTRFTGHALDMMQSRGLTPRVILDVIKHGTRTTGRGGASIFTKDGVRAITNSAGDVITVFPFTP